MEVGRYVDAKLLLPHVSVTAFTSDSTSKPAPHSRLTGDANLPALIAFLLAVCSKTASTNANSAIFVQLFRDLVTFN